MKRLRSSVASSVILCGSALVACLSGPRRLLVASTPDRRHEVEVVEIDGRAALHIDGRRGDAFQAILASTLTFDAAGRHVAYGVLDGDRYRLALDHCPGPPFEGLGDIAFSPDGERLAYAAADGGRWRIVADGALGPALDGVFARTLRFDSEGVHLAYVAAVAGGARVFVDQVAGPLVDAVSELRLPRDGRVGYVARRGSLESVMRGDEAIGVHNRVGALWIGEDGRSAYAARSERGWTMIYDGTPLSSSPLLPEVAGSDDGTHVAWLARGVTGVSVWLDRSPFAGPFANVRSQSLRFAPGHAAPSFVAQGSDGRPRAFIAGAEQPALDRLGALVFSADGRHWAYTGGRGPEHVLIRDGIEQVLDDAIADPVLSPAGDRIALVPRAPPARLIVDGREHVFSLLLPDTFAFGRDGRHWAVLAGSSAERRLYFAVDGALGPSFDFAELISRIGGADAEGVRVPDALLRDWARATADATTPPSEQAPPDPRAGWLSGKCERRVASTPER
jgi:hypothetical protein